MRPNTPKYEILKRALRNSGVPAASLVQTGLTGTPKQIEKNGYLLDADMVSGVANIDIYGDNKVFNKIKRAIKNTGLEYGADKNSISAWID